MSRRRGHAIRVVMMTALVSAAAAHADHMVTYLSPATQTLNLGVASRFPFQMRRFNDAGIDLTGSVVTQTYVAANDGGQFAFPREATNWTTTGSSFFGSGTSLAQWRYFRSVRPGPHTITVLSPPYAPVQVILNCSEQIVEDPFEGTELTFAVQDAGFWSSLSSQPGVTFQFSPSSAHRGAAGLQVNDADGTLGPGAEGKLELQTAPLALPIYFRGWVRISGSSGRSTIAQIAESNSYSFAEVKVQIDDGGIDFGGHTNGGYQTVRASAPFTRDTWHLVEMVSFNDGGVLGERSLAIDSQVVATMNNLDWAGRFTGAITIGEPFADDRQFIGTIDFDDVRAATTRFASHIRVAHTPQPFDGGCQAAVVVLEDAWDRSFGFPAIPITVNVTAQGSGASLYSNALCTVPASTVSFAATDPVALVYFTTSGPGAVTFNATHIDLFSEPVTTYVLFPDGGNPALDGGVDSGIPDSGIPDAGVVDAGANDAGLSDSGAADAGPNDSGVSDSGEADAGAIDSGPSDAGAIVHQLSVGCGCQSGGDAAGALLALLAFTRRRGAERRFPRLFPRRRTAPAPCRPSDS